MSKQSNVGGSGIYEADDQRNYKDSELQQDKAEQRYHEGQPHSHKQIDSSKSPYVVHDCALNAPVQSR